MMSTPLLNGVQSAGVGGVFSRAGWVCPTLSELASLFEEQRQQALERFRVLRPHLERGRPAWRGKPTWFARTGTSDKPRHPRVQETVEGVALQRRAWSISSLYRRVLQHAEERGVQPPTYSVMDEIVRAFPADVVTIAQQGSQAYSDTHELVRRL